MAKASPIQPAYVAGELSPLMRGRVDNERWKVAMELCNNFIPLIQGPLQKRPGLKYVANVADDTVSSKLIPFEFSTTQTYVLEFGNGTLRVLKDRDLVETSDTGSITNITQANPAVVTITSHPFSDGEVVRITGVSGMTDVNNRVFTVANSTANTFELSGVDSTSYAAYSSGGTATEIYQISSPYGTADLDEIRWTQSADTLFLFHEDYEPRTLVRTGDAAWTFSTYELEDGPWKEEPSSYSTYMTLDDAVNIVPDMTNNSTPSGTVSDSAGSSNAYKAFDRNLGEAYSNNGNSGWVQYDLGVGNSKACDAYWVAASDNNSGATRAPSSWNLQGSDDGSTWITLDSRGEETGWSQGERRYYEFPNSSAYRYHRFAWKGVNGDSSMEVGGIALHWAASDQEAQSATITLTASAVTDINDGDGFQTTDVGRHVRVIGDDGRWRWLKIHTRNSTTEVEVYAYGHAFDDDDTSISRFQLGRFSETTSWPANGAFYEDRLFIGGPGSEWYASQVGDYPNFGSALSDDTTTDATAISVPNLLSRQVNAVRWISTDENSLLMGTSGAEWVVRPANSNEGLSSSNVRNRAATFRGSDSTPPVQAEGAILFLSYDKQSIHEMAYVFEVDGYRSPNLSWLAEHLTAESGIAELSYSKKPQPIVWCVRQDGVLLALNYEREQNVVAWSRHSLADGSLLAERVASITNSSNDTDTYFVVKKGSQRFICYLDPLWVTSNTTSDAFFVDAGIVYDGASTSTIGDLYHLEGESVTGVADGESFTKTVANGTITLDSAATKVSAGLGYTSEMQSMPLNAGATDGTSQGKTKRIHQVVFRILNSRGGEYAYDQNATKYPFNFNQSVSKNFTTASNLTTGDAIVRWPAEYAYDGVVYVRHADPYPFTLIAHMPQVVTQDRG